MKCCADDAVLIMQPDSSRRQLMRIIKDYNPFFDYKFNGRGENDNNKMLSF